DRYDWYVCEGKILHGPGFKSWIDHTEQRNSGINRTSCPAPGEYLLLEPPVLKSPRSDKYPEYYANGEGNGEQKQHHPKVVGHNLDLDRRYSADDQDVGR